MATGALAYLGISKQNSFGTATTSWHWTPFVSETLAHRIDKLAMQGIRNSLVEMGALPGIDRAEGDLVLEPDPVTLGYFLRGVLGVPSTSVIASGYLYQHVFEMRFSDWTQKCPVPASTMAVWRGVEDVFEFTDVIFPRMQLAIEANALVRASFSAIGRTVSLTAQGSYGTTPNFSGATENPWTWATASVSINGSAPEVYETINLTVDGMLEGVIVLDATRKFNKFGRRDRPTVRLNGRIDLENLNEYDRFAAQSTVPFFVNLAPQVVGSASPYMLLEVPKFQYDSIDAAVAGPGRVSVDWAGRAMYHAGSQTALRITLVNSQINYEGAA